MERSGTMAEDDDARRVSLPWPAFAIAAAVLGLGAWFYFSVVMPAGDAASGASAETWGVRGDSMGPFAALFNAGALFAALWAVHLQRRELHDTRAEMKEQRKQFERTAKAQEALAHAQDAANSLAPFQELAVRRLTEATLFQVLLRSDLAKLDYDEPAIREIGETLKGMSEVVRVHMAEERLRILELERELAIARRDEWERR
jgi:hypothetical protein